MKRGDFAAIALFVAQAAWVFHRALYIPPVLPGLGDQYFNVPLWPLSDALGSIRTLGYPMFHAFMAHYGWGLESYPTFQMMLLIPCVFVLWLGLRAYGLTGLAAMAAVSPLLWLVPVELVMPETPAKCFAIAATGFLLWAAGTRRLVAYLGLAASVFLACQMRPAFLFLVGFLPAAWLFLYTRRWGALDQYRWVRHALSTGAACVLPLFLFCLLRLVIVGHFGLVSFGGQNTIGIAVEMLSPETIEKLPARDRPLALVMNRARTAWPAERFINDRGLAADWSAIAELYTVNVNRIGRAVQAKFPPADGAANNVEEDKSLSRMSISTFLARQDLYGAWLAGAAMEGARVAFEMLLGGGGDQAFAWGPSVSRALMASLFALMLLGWPMERRAFGEGSRPHYTRAATVVLFVAVLFFLLKMLLVILVEPPIPRYVQAAAFLLPCALAALGWDRAVVLAAGLCRRPWWYGQCLADYPHIPDLHRPLPWRAWLTTIKPGRRGITATAGLLAVLLAAAWWTTRDNRFFTALAGQPGEVRAHLLESSAPPTLRDEDGATVLHYAALQGDATLVSHLLDAGAAADVTANDGASPLHWAVLGAGGASVIAPLLAKGASAGAPGPLGLSPLHLASLAGNAESLGALLGAGVDPNLKSPGGVAPLHLAGSIEAARVLLDGGANVDEPDGAQATPFMAAHTRELATFLLERGANINAKEDWRSFVRGCTPLHKAAYQSDIETARWLLDRGAELNPGDISDMSPLFYAIWRNNRPLAELLLDRGADPNHAGRWLAYHRDSPGERYTDIYGKTIGRHPRRHTFADLVPDNAAIRPLDWAAFLGNTGMLDLLLARGADPALHNDAGMSALHWAVLGFRDDIARRLRARDPGKTLLDDARLPIEPFKAAVLAGTRDLNTPPL